MHRVGIGPDAHRWESCKPLVRRVQPKLRGFANPHGHATFRDRDCLPSSHVAVVQTRSLRGAPRCASGGPMTERPRGRLCSSLPASGTRSRHRGATSAARLLVGSMLILLELHVLHLQHSERQPRLGRTARRTGLDTSRNWRRSRLKRSFRLAACKGRLITFRAGHRLRPGASSGSAKALLSLPEPPIGLSSRESARRSYRHREVEFDAIADADGFFCCDQGRSGSEKRVCHDEVEHTSAGLLPQ